MILIKPSTTKMEKIDMCEQKLLLSGAAQGKQQAVIKFRRPVIMKTVVEDDNRCTITMECERLHYVKEKN